MIINKAIETDRLKWDNYALSHSDATPYHLWAWKEAVEAAYGHKAHYLIAEEQGKIRGILPLFQLKLFFLQNQLVSLPFCDVAGPIADDYPTRESLLKKAQQAATQYKATTLELRTRLSHQSTISNNSKVSMLLPLPANPKELWNSFKSKLRSQILKAEKNGLVFRIGEGDEDINSFYQVFSQNMLELGSPVHSKCFFASILKSYGDFCRMGLVFLDEKPIGCGIILFCGTHTAIPWASTIRKYNKLSPNMLLYWNLLQFSIKAGANLFDFGRSTLNSGTYRFKAQWGAQPTSLHWDKLPSDINQYHIASPASPKQHGIINRQLAANLWSKLPLPIANLIGPKLRQYISL